MKKTKQFISLMFSAFVFLVGMILCYPQNHNVAQASTLLEVGFASDTYVLYEAEEKNFFQLKSNQETNEAFEQGFEIGFRVLSATAEYGTNYSTKKPSAITAKTTNGMLMFELESIFQNSYDSGKFFEIELFSLDENKYIVSPNFSSAQIFIKDKNPDGYVSIISEDKIVFENENFVNFTIQCSPNFFGVDIKLAYFGSAQNNIDYIAPLDVYIPAGQTQKDVRIELIDNNLKNEVVREILVFLDEVSSGAEIASIPNNTSITIKDDESIGVVSFLKQQDQVVEFDGDYVLVIERQDGTQGDLTFNLEMTTNAIFEVQYKNNPSGEYTLYDGETSKSIRLKLIEDKTYTGSLNFSFKLKQKAGNNVVFGIKELSLIRKDSLKASEIVFNAEKLAYNGQYGTVLSRYDYHLGTFYKISLDKTVGGKVSFKYYATISTQNSFTEKQLSTLEVILNGFVLNKEITIESNNYEKETLFSQEFANLLSNNLNINEYIGNFVLEIRFYDFNAETHMNNLQDTTVSIFFNDTAGNGVYELGEVKRNANTLIATVFATTPSLQEAVNATLEMYHEDVLLKSEEISFSPYTAKVSKQFDLICDEYNAILENFRTITFKVVFQTLGAVVTNDTSSYDILKGSGGVVGFYRGRSSDYYNQFPAYEIFAGIDINILPINEGQAKTITLAREKWDYLPRLEVPVFLKEPTSYFNDISIPVVIVIFEEGQTVATAVISFSNDNQILPVEANQLYIKNDDPIYSVVSHPGVYLKVSDDVYGTFETRYLTSPYFNVNIYNTDDYGKVGFDYKNFSQTITEGEQTEINLKKIGGIDTPVSFYVSSTNLPRIPEISSIIVTKNGGILSFVYDDSVWSDYLLEDRFITISIISPVGDLNVNQAGLIQGASDFTLWIIENESLMEIDFELSKNASWNSEKKQIEVVEQSPNDGSFELIFKTKLFVDNFNLIRNIDNLFQVYSITPQGEEKIVQLSKTISGKDADGKQKFVVTIPFAYSTSQNDIVFVLKVLPARNDVLIKQGVLELKVEVKNQPALSTITISTPSFEIYENVERFDFMLKRTNFEEADKTINIEEILNLSGRIGEYNFLLNNVVIENDSFLWKAGVESVMLSLIWQDNKIFNHDEEDFFELNLSGDAYTSSNPLNFKIRDDEINGALKFYQDLLAYTQENPLVLISNDGSINHFFEIDRSDFETQRFSIYYSIIALDSPETSNIQTESFIRTSSPPFAYIRIDGIVGVTYFKVAKYKIVITGCDLNIEINEDNLHQRTIYFNVVLAPTKLQITPSQAIGERFDEVSIFVERLINNKTKVEVSYELDAYASQIGFALSENKTVLEIGQKKVSLKLTSPTIKYLPLIDKFNINATFVCYDENNEIVEQAKTITFVVSVFAEGQYIFTLNNENITVSEGDTFEIVVSRGLSVLPGRVTLLVPGLDSRLEQFSSDLIFEIGETSKTFLFTIENNKEDNGVKTFEIKLTNALGGADAFGISSTFVTVKDDDFFLNTAQKQSFNESFTKYIWTDMDQNGVLDLVGMTQDGIIAVYYANTTNYSKTTLSLKQEANSVLKNVYVGGINYILVISDHKINMISSSSDKRLSVVSYSVNYAFNSESKVEVGHLNYDGVPEICFINDEDLTKLYYFSISENGVIKPSANVYDAGLNHLSEISINHDGNLLLVDKEQNNNLTTPSVESSLQYVVIEANKRKETKSKISAGSINLNHYSAELNSYKLSVKYVLGPNNNSFYNNSYALVKYYSSLGQTANYQYVLKSDLKNNLYTFSYGKNVEKLVPTNLQKDNEFVVLIDGNLHILFDRNDGNGLVLSAVLETGLSDFQVIDCYDNGKFSISYLKENKVYFIENPFNSTLIDVSFDDITVYDTDEYIDLILTRKGSLNRQHTISFSTLDGSAIKNVDYKSQTYDITFNILEKTKVIRIYLLDTQNFPTDKKEFFVVLQSDDTSVKFKKSVLTISIIDTDISGDAFFETESVYFYENEGVVSVNVNRDAKTSYDLLVDYEIVFNLGVENGVDVNIFLSGTLNFQNHTSTIGIQFSLINDDLLNILFGKDNSTRYFNIVLSNPRAVGFDFSNYPQFAPRIKSFGTLRVFILDDEKIVKHVEMVDKGKLEDEKLLESGNEILSKSFGNNEEVVEKYDFNKDGRNDTYAISNYDLILKLNVGDIDEYEKSFSLSSLRNLYGVTNGFQTIKYVSSLNQFILVDDFNDSVLGFSVLKTTQGLNLVANGTNFQIKDEIGLKVSLGTRVPFEIKKVLSGITTTFGDFDGDGKLDVFYLHYSYDVSTAIYALSTQNYCLINKQTLDMPKNRGTTDFVCEVISKDLNGDGIDDIFLNQRRIKSSLLQPRTFLALNFAQGLGNFEAISTNNISARVNFLPMDIEGRMFILLTADYSAQYFTYGFNEKGVFFCGDGYFVDNTTKKEILSSSANIVEVKIYKVIKTGEYYLHSFSKDVWDVFSKININIFTPIVLNTKVSENQGFVLVEVLNPSGKANVFDYYTVNQIAVNQENFALNIGKLFFQEGQTSKTIKISLIDNVYQDGDKDFYLFISYKNSYNKVFYSYGKIIILDNESTNGLTKNKTLYHINEDFEFKTFVDYNIETIVLEDSDGNKSYGRGDMVVAKFTSLGMKTVILTGYNAQNTRVFYDVFEVKVIPAVIENTFTIKMPQKVTENTSVEVEFTFVKQYEGFGYGVLDAEISFIDPFTLQNVKVKTDIAGKAYYSMMVIKGDYGNFNLFASATSYLGNAMANSYFNLESADAFVTGYVLLPEGNIGASNILVSIGGLTTTTNQDGYFSLKVTAGQNYDLIINKNQQNLFYSQTQMKVLHNKAITIVSASLEYAKDDLLSFNLKYFYYSYTGGYTEYAYQTQNFRYAVPIQETRYKSMKLNMQNRFSSPAELPLLSVLYPSNSNVVTTKTSSGKYVHATSVFGNGQYVWNSWNTYGKFSSRTELYFEIPLLSQINNYYKDLEFVVCDADGNTLRILKNVSYSGVLNRLWQPINETQNMLSKNGCEYYVSAGETAYIENFIKLSITQAEVNEDERLYIRRVTNNDVFYYYTGISFGRSLGEKTRDDIGEKFAQVETRAIPKSMEVLKDTVFGINSFTAEFDMVVNEVEKTAVVYLGYAVRTRNLTDIPPSSQEASVTVMSPPWLDSKYGMSATMNRSLKMYYGGIFTLKYDKDSKSWKYTSGVSTFYGTQSSSTRIEFSYAIAMGVTVYVYGTLGTQLTSNIELKVEDGELIIYGDSENQISYESGNGISVTIAKAEIWVRYTGYYVLQFGEISGSRMSIRMDGGTTVYFLWFKYKRSWVGVTFAYNDTTYTVPEVEIDTNTLSDIDNNDYSAYCVEVDENGILVGTIKDVVEKEITEIVPETVVEAKPVLVQYGNKSMMVYKQTAITKNDITYETLFYSINTDGVWKSPQLVTSLVRDVSEFSVSVYNNKPVIAFSHTTVEKSILNQMVNVDISVAIFVPQTNKFDLQSITNDNLPDSKPLITANGNDMLLIYAKTYRVDYTLDTTLAEAFFSDRELNYVMYAKYNNLQGKFENSQVLLRGAYNTIEQDLAIVRNKAYYTFLADMDNNLSTSEDVEVMECVYDFETEIWSGEKTLSNNGVAETHLKVLNVDNRVVYLWLNRYGINIKLPEGDSYVLNTREKGDIVNFTAKVLNNDILIVWNESVVSIENDKSNSLYFSLVNLEGKLGVRKVLTASNDVILDYDVIAKENSVYVVYNNSKRIDDTTTKYTLIGTEVNYIQTAGIENAYTASGRFRTDVQETFFFDVVNTGDFSLKNLRVVVRENNQQGKFLYTALIENIERGDFKTLSFSSKISAEMYGLFITVEEETLKPENPDVFKQTSTKLFAASSCVFAISKNVRTGMGAVVDGEINSILMRQEILNLETVETISTQNKVKLILKLENKGDLDSRVQAKINYYLAGKEDAAIRILDIDIPQGEALDYIVELTFEELEQYASAKKTVGLVVSLYSTTASFEKFAHTCFASLEQTYSLTLDLGWGNTQKAYFVNGEISFIETPIKEGYTFLGWYSNKNFTQKVEFPISISENTIIYAKWQSNQSSNENIVVLLVSVLGGFALIIGVVYVLGKKKIIKFEKLFKRKNKNEFEEKNKTDLEFKNNKKEIKKENKND